MDQPPRASEGRSPAVSPSIPQVVDALILYDTPMLDHRFQEAISMHPDAHTRAALAALPPKVAEGSRLTRRAATEWDRVTGHSALDDPFKARAEHVLLEALLESAEAQIRLKSFMSRHAPTRDVRDDIDGAIAIHRHLVDELRKAICLIDPAEPADEREDEPREPRDARGDLRSEVEESIRRMIAKGATPRELVLSANALRHLRDQGLFRNGQARALDVPVRVDFSWPGMRFALLSLDSATLDEILCKDQGTPEL